ncbi:MAG: histidine--tRNA ligase, partial [bacterium]|nr:histidine--tRNA ligase [bacterium]
RDIRPVKGMRDFYPEDWSYQKWLCEQFTSVGRQFGYQEYEAPVLEHIELYLGKSSEEIMGQQTFTLKDRDENPLVMRPELTPSLARMVAQKENQLVYPIRWQSYGQFFRYEKPQRGRGRAFYQWNVDALGSESPIADAEIITVACTLLKQLGISPQHATIKVNDREALERLLVRKLKLDADAVRPIFGAIDRIDKMPQEKFREYLILDHKLSDGQVDDLYGIFGETDLSFSPWLQKVFDHLAHNQVDAYAELDLHIVRGFDYYTSTVFEAWAKTSLRRALFGGGRYDNLTVQVGGNRAVPGVGFAVGDMAMTELLKELHLCPVLDSSCAEILVTVFSEAELEISARFAHQLRQAGISTEMQLAPGQRLDKQFKYADNKGIAFAVVIGPDEAKTQTLVLKDLKNRAQILLHQTDMPKILETMKRGIS